MASSSSSSFEAGWNLDWANLWGFEVRQAAQELQIAMGERNVVTGNQVTRPTAVNTIPLSQGLVLWKEWADAFQDSMSTLLMFFVDFQTGFSGTSFTPSSTAPQIWTEATIMDALGQTRILPDFGTLAREWFRQQFDMLNLMIWAKPDFDEWRAARTGAGDGTDSSFLTAQGKAEADYATPPQDPGGFGNRPPYAYNRAEKNGTFLAQLRTREAQARFNQPLGFDFEMDTYIKAGIGNIIGGAAHEILSFTKQGTLLPIQDGLFVLVDTSANLISGTIGDRSIVPNQPWVSEPATVDVTGWQVNDQFAISRFDVVGGFTKVEDVVSSSSS